MYLGWILLALRPSQRAEGVSQIQIMTLFPWPTPMETMARVVPLWAWLSILRRGSRSDKVSAYNKTFSDETQRQLYMISFSLSLSLCNHLCGSDNQQALQHHCHSASLFIYLDKGWPGEMSLRPLRKDNYGSLDRDPHSYNGENLSMLTNEPRRGGNASTFHSLEFKIQTTDRS